MYVYLGTAYIVPVASPLTMEASAVTPLMTVASVLRVTMELVVRLLVPLSLTTLVLTVSPLMTVSLGVRVIVMLVVRVDSELLEPPLMTVRSAVSPFVTVV